MVTLISKDDSVVNKLAVALDKSTNGLLKRDFEVIASEFLAKERAIEQIELFKSEVKKISNIDFKGKKLLEIGAGVGTFLITARNEYGIDAFGIEPSEDEFSPFNEVSNALLDEHKLPKDIVIRGNAENLPFSDETFDLIYSTNVLEHVQDPKKVLEESIRVLKVGGFLQFVIPSYFSFWEGHYSVFWPCITNRFLAKIYTKLIGQNPGYIDTLQLISPFYLRRILSSKDLRDKIEAIGWGKDVFKKRLETGNYTDWASIRKIRPLVQLVQNLGLASLAADIVNVFEMHTPIVLTLKKIKL